MPKKVRVSCPGLCRIMNNYEQFLLILNRDRFRKGRKVLMPIGGALKTTRKSLKELDLEFEEDIYVSSIRRYIQKRLRSEADLRFYICEENIEAYKQWFYSRLDR